MSAELAQAWLTIMRGTEVNRFGDETDVGTVIYEHVPAALTETARVTFDRASQTRRTVRTVTCVLSGYTDVTDDDTLRDEVTGAAYLIESMQRQPALNGAPADLILTLRERSGVSVASD